ncbi:hypothetical protein CAOG_04343 [Capsaspora owczarzaki ATCC 30864]|uniref:Uncharacterized protein n=1 Tax=Capsaspora owczarzaki (strain ATCC 30864) TaxID=595528 RepID=A0A0D2UEN6_CAPO3|nr:hypothetical protein CAOG_04343 [Capsaspora owczarzaki ATCC 30864]KJE93576.1 hypothetical protein CAOG_004343 [Capsaspora owczarzaki ATCC 30864]|eukprot:XP_004348171.1 hypothetical protein CAOG_04343 [Capsaspora owczarzaki ATCC 30864]
MPATVKPSVNAPVVVQSARARVSQWLSPEPDAPLPPVAATTSAAASTAAAAADAKDGAKSKQQGKTKPASTPASSAFSASSASSAAAKVNGGSSNNQSAPRPARLGLGAVAEQIDPEAAAKAAANAQLNTRLARRILNVKPSAGTSRADIGPAPSSTQFAGRKGTKRPANDDDEEEDASESKTASIGKAKSAKAKPAAATPATAASKPNKTSDVKHQQDRRVKPRLDTEDAESGNDANEQFPADADASDFASNWDDTPSKAAKSVPTPMDDTWQNANVGHFSGKMSTEALDGESQVQAAKQAQKRRQAPKPRTVVNPDGTVTEIKPKKYRSRQKNIRKDNRPPELKPNYLVPKPRPNNSQKPKQPSAAASQ